jgi:integrase
MSLHKVEHWEVSWHEASRPRSRRLKDKAEAEAVAGGLERERHRPSTRHVVQWRVCWREGGRDSQQRQRTFDRKRDAEDFDREVKRRKRLGELALWEHRNQTVRELAREWWAKYAVPNLAELTLDGYEPVLSKHVVRRLGGHRVGEVTPEVVADFRAQLERSGVGRHAVRISLVVLQAMFKQAGAWGWVATNPVKAVPKPTGRRERAVVCLAPTQVEAIRAWLIGRDKLYAATIVSLVAYQGLRVPEEVLAIEVRHVRSNTLLVEQRNIKGKIVAGQKVRGFHPRAVDWVEPARRDVSEYLMASGMRSGVLFPREDGQPWKVHDYKNWTRRVWHKAREGAIIERLPPYDLRHAFASLQIRAGLSIPELAEQMGHSPQMTVGTYAHVIRELKGEPRVSAEDQIELARRAQPRPWKASG